MSQEHISNQTTNILIVADNPKNLFALETVLQNARQNIIKARSEKEALEHIVCTDFAAILLDVPDVDRFEISSFIRQRKKTPIIFVTDVTYVTEEYSFGAIDYIFKPFVPEIVSSKVQILVDLFQQNQQLEKQRQLLAFSNASLRQVKKELAQKNIELEQNTQLLEKRVAERTKKFSSSMLSLEKQTAILQSILDNMGDGMVVTDKDGNFLLCNPAAENILDIGAEDYNIHKWLENRENSLQSKESFPILQAIEGKQVTGAELFIRYKKIDTWLSVNARPLKDRNDEIKGSVTVFRDVSLEREEDRERLMVTLSSMSEGVIVVDGQKKIVLFNPMAETLTGWSIKQTKEKSIDDVFCVVNDVKKPMDNFIERVIQTKKIEKWSHVTLITKQKEEIPIAISASPIHRKDETIIGAVVVFRDMTQEREIERMKEDFVSSVTHELRTPLTSIKAFTATLLRDPNMTKENRDRFIDIIAKETDRLAGMVEELLEVSRLESGDVKLANSPVDIAAVVDQVLLALKPLMDKKNLISQKDIPDKLPILQGDPDKIHSVITNLVNNAIKFTPKGKIAVALKHIEKELIVCISDTGMGIPKEDISKIFSRFYRVHRSGTQIQGTGLGLAIVHKIVTLHGGRIEIESEVNKGTTFTIFLPVRRTNE